MSALVLAAASIASTGAMAQSSKTNAWEGAYGQWSVGFASLPSALYYLIASISPSKSSAALACLIGIAFGPFLS